MGTILWQGTSKALISAVEPLFGETNGLEIDFTSMDGLGRVWVKDTTTPANVRAGVSIHTFLRQLGNEPKLVEWSDGLLRWSPHNLIVYSEDLTVWALGGSTITANATAASDGAMTADKIAEDASGGIHFAYLNLGVVHTGEPYTFSAELKAAERTWAYLRSDNGGENPTWFDLASGVVGTVAAGCTASITALGGGWYRCSVRTVPTGGGAWYGVIGATTGNGVTNYAGTPGSGIYASRAQCIRGTITQPYIPTTTAARAGVGMEYDRATAQFDLLIEPSAGNYLFSSRQFNDVAAWGPSDVVVAADQVAGPDGLVLAEKLTDTTAVAIHHLLQNLTAGYVTASQTYNFSIFAKYINHQYVGLRIWDGVGVFAPVVFDLLNGTVTSTPAGYATATITPVGTAGWWRLSVARVADAAPTAGQIAIFFADGPTYAGGAYAGTGTDAFYVDFAQFEIGTNYATSPIPTTNYPVGRTADQYYVPVSEFPYAAGGAGSAYVEAMHPVGGGGYLVDFNAGPSHDEWAMLYTSGLFGALIVLTGAAVQAQLTNVGVVTLGVIFKLAGAWALNDFAVVHDGGVPLTDAAGTLPSPTQLQLGSSTGPTKVRRLLYVPRRMSNSEMQERTTPPSFGGMLLDDIGLAAARAYSLRKLRAAYAGSAIRVRRSSDNAEQDIGFVGEDLDTAALLTFAGAVSVYIAKYYDQSGNALDCVAPTAAAQPRIVNAGVLETKNGRPAAYYDGIDDYLETAGAVAAGQDGAAVLSTTESGPNWPDYRQALGGGYGQHGFIGGAGTPGYYGGGFFGGNVAVNNGPNASVFGGALQQIIGIGSVSGWSPLRIGNDPNFAGRCWPGHICEVVVFVGSVSGRRATLYVNQKTYWGTP